MRSICHKGFTLIELSIVLVIIGLIVGGVLAGKSLIETAKMRSIVTQLQSYETAMQVFYNKYNCIPGDCANATTFFPNPSSYSCGSGADLVGSGNVCNGNGNAQIEYISTSEPFQAWRQMALAGLISGNYTGVSGPAHVYIDPLPGTNVPALKGFGTSAGINLYYAANSFSVGAKGLTTPALPINKNVFLIFSPVDTSKNVLTPSEAYYVDTKMDDGHPAKGSVQSPDAPWAGPYYSTCFNTKSDWDHLEDWYYDLSSASDSPQCLISTGLR